MPNTIVIIGSGGVGREIAATLKHLHFVNQYVLEGFIDDGSSAGTIINNLPVLGNIDWLIAQNQFKNVIIAIGNPSVREKIYNRLKDFNFQFPTIIHPSAQIHDHEFCKIGEGSYIAAQVVMTTNVTIEDFCFINTACTLQHDTHIEKNCTLMPGVRITGGATIGHGSYLSANLALTTSVIVPSLSKL